MTTATTGFTDETACQIADRLDRAQIESAARWAAARLNDPDCGVARVELAPGDATVYRFIVTNAPRWTRNGVIDPIMFTVAYGHGDSYQWTGCDMHWSYCAAKWARNRPYDGVVVCLFLSALADALTVVP